ncbi:MAG: DUF1461 domain-containing protein [Nanobdellota archaeon]
MGLKILRLATISLCYILILLSISVLTVFLVTPLHTPFLGDEDYSHVDSAVSEYIIHGDEARLRAETGLTHEEASHMSDVRDVVKAISLLGVAGVFVLTFLRVRTREEKVVMLASPLYLNSLVGTTVLTSAIIGFSRVFEAFHQIFFAQGNYAFSYSSLLIRTYPESFFAIQGVLLFVVFTGIAIVIAATYRKKCNYPKVI